MDSRWVVLALVLLLVQVYGSCFWGPLKDADGPEPFCIGRTPDEKLYLGDHVLTEDCFNCSCSQYGLSCCGVGPFNRGYMRLPPGCEIIPEKNCKYSINCEDVET